MTLTQIARRIRAGVPTAFARRSALFTAEVVNQAETQEVVWVYAVADRTESRHLSGLAGVGGEPVRVVAEAGLHAVVGSVDAAAFGENSIAAMLADLTHIEAIGRAHHGVVASIAAESPVVPLRLATIYPDDMTVSMLLSEHREELAELLDSLRGTEEWGVQVYLGPAGGDAAAAPGPGRADPGQSWIEAEASAWEIDRTLAGISVAARRQPSPYLRPGSGSGWMVLNGVYLVDRWRAVEFTATAQQLAAEHATLRVEVTGPWPPYSFVDREGSLSAAS